MLRWSLLAAAILASLVAACGRPASTATAGTEVDRLIDAYRHAQLDSVDAAQAAADEIRRLGVERGDPLLEARGLIRLAYVELSFGRWRNDWSGSLDRAVELCGSSQTVARAEVLTYRGYMRGKWLKKIDDGQRDLLEARWLARSLRADDILAVAYCHDAELHLYESNTLQAVSSALRAVAIAESTDDDLLLRMALMRAVLSLSKLDPQMTSARPCAQRLVDLGSEHALPLDVLARTGEGTVDPTRLRERLAELTANPDAELIDRVEIAETKHRLTRLLATNGELEEALDLAHEALRFYRGVDNKTDARKIALEALNIEARLGHTDLAIDAVAELFEDNYRESDARSLESHYQAVGDLEAASLWGERADARAVEDLARVREELMAIATSAWDFEQRDRATADAVSTVQANQRATERALWAFSAFTVVTILGMLTLRSREKTQMVRALRDEIRRREREEAKNQELRGQMVEAQRLESIGTLAAGVAHDFNNTLTAILGNAELLRYQDEPAQRETTLDAMIGAAESATRVTRGLLTFARSQPSQETPVDLVDLVRRSHALIEHVLPASIELSLELPEREAVLVLGEHKRLEQVLMNLILNARDAIDGFGRVRIALRCDSPREGWASVSVADSGSGIAEEHRGRMFEPFFTTKSRGEGTGLGLAVVHGTVRDHGGRIRVESGVGRGTTIIVELPLTDRTLDDPSSDGVVLQPVNTGPVLLVEDSAPVRHSLRAHLEQAGFEVHDFGDGPSALEHFDDRQWHAAVLDNDLPKMTGEEVLRELRARAPQLPAVLISGLPVSTSLDRTTCLGKPFTGERLNDALARLLD